MASKDDQRGVALNFNDVQVSGSQLSVRLRQSKTDQRRRGTAIILTSTPPGDPCPVQSVADYLTVRPPLPGPLLLHANGQCLSRYHFSAVLRTCIGQLSMPPVQFGIHSFRIGVATHAFKEGRSPSEIMSVGRWRSAAFKAYVRPGLSLGLDA